MRRLATGGLAAAALLFQLIPLFPHVPAAAQCESACSPVKAPDGIVAAAAAELLALANSARAAAGLFPLEHRGDIADVATGHSQAMAAAGEIFHNDAYFTSTMKTRLGISGAGENVAMAGSVAAAHQALMDSDLHRANIVNGSFRVAGFGVYRKNGALYVTEAFGVPKSGTFAQAAPAPRPAAAAPTAASPATAQKAAPKPTTTIARSPASAPPTTMAEPVPLPIVTMQTGPEPTGPSEMATETPVPSSNTATSTPAAAPAVVLLAAVTTMAAARLRRRIITAPR